MIKTIANLCFLGAFLAFGIGVRGLFKFPDAYTRLHACGLGDTMGVGLISLGLFLLTPDKLMRLKLIMVLALFWVINPTMSHLIAKAGLLNGTMPAEGTGLRKG
ncbi:MAG: monovalent cation/H(+) antiporter subunit G [Limnochordia bacterium]|jgi:multicomponent Na+:H+ antiporter subunit G